MTKHRLLASSKNKQDTGRTDYTWCGVVSTGKSVTDHLPLIACLSTMHAGEQRVCMDRGDLQQSAHTACMRVTAVSMLPSLPASVRKCTCLHTWLTSISASLSLFVSLLIFPHHLLLCQIVLQTHHHPYGNGRHTGHRERICCHCHLAGPSLLDPIPLFPAFLLHYLLLIGVNKGRSCQRGALLEACP